MQKKPMTAGVSFPRSDAEMRDMAHPPSPLAQVSGPGRYAERSERGCTLACLAVAVECVVDVNYDATYHSTVRARTFSFRNSAANHEF